MTYLSKINDLKTELESNKNILISKFEINEPLSSDIMVDIPKELKDFYSEMNGVSIEWSSKDNPELLIGLLNILPYESAIGTALNNFLNNYGDYLDNKPVLILDDFTIPGTDDKLCYISNGDIIHYKEDETNLKIGFNQYFDACLKGKAIIDSRAALIVDITGKEFTTAFSDFAELMDSNFPESEYKSMFTLHKAPKKEAIVLYNINDVNDFFINDSDLTASDYSDYTFFIASPDSKFYNNLNKSIPEDDMSKEVADKGMKFAYKVLNYCQTNPKLRDMFGLAADSGFKSGFHTASVESATEFIKQSDYSLLNFSDASPAYIFIKAYKEDGSLVTDMEYFVDTFLLESENVVSVIDGVFAVPYELKELISGEPLFYEGIIQTNSPDVKRGMLIEVKEPGELENDVEEEHEEVEEKPGFFKQLLSAIFSN